MTQKPKTSLIALCNWPHRDVWRISSNLIPKYVDADSYRVYVPLKEQRKFIRATGPKFDVVPETRLDLSFSEALRTAVEVAGNKGRFGWYFQQFIKLQAILQDPNENIIIWDSDCVPVRNVRLFEGNAVPLMYSAQEYNPDYFLTIKKLLNLEKLRQESFIVPGFPIKKSTVQKMIAEIERRHHATWAQALISNIDFSKQSGFSEYETMGTWVMSQHPETRVSPNLKWERFGQSRFGYPQVLGEKGAIEVGLKFNLDVISFETWDFRSFKKTFAAVKKRLKHLLASN